MKKISFITIIVLAIFACGLAFTQEITEVTEVTTVAPAEPAKQRFNIGAGYWYTWGSLDTELNASDSVPGYYLKGDKISELNYDTDGGLFVINAEAWIWWRFYVDGLVAWGDVRDGEQVDSDWLMQISTSKWMESKASAEGDITLWNINGYLRIIDEPEDKGYLDFALGYAYYQDDISPMTDLVYYLVDWTQTVEPYAGLHSTDKYTFDGIRLGARGRISLHERVAIKGSVGLMPWLDADRDGYWNLRDMKIEGSADASGFDCDICVEFKITKNIFIEGGYKYINIDTDEGDYSHIFSDGTRLDCKDGWGDTEVSRGGFYGMARLKF